jgi:hypothetical protein
MFQIQLVYTADHHLSVLHSFVVAQVVLSLLQFQTCTLHDRKPDPL